MANYTTSANVVISVNGRQAQEMMRELENDAARLEKKIAQASQASDRVSMKKFQRELQNTHKLMDQLRGRTVNAEAVLKRLDKATPRELNKALRQLKQQLNGIERGTAAWDAHVNKIKAVKAEIDRVNSSLNSQQSGWDKFKSWVQRAGTSIAALAAAVTGLVTAGRKFVEEYAAMDQEMANVRKFTGMTAEEVESLNEELKKIDTRTSREDLNKLAQEAGRLGKTSQEDVLGFVRAADKINVALDDLGEGATLTLSKLAGIYGDEQRLGTEKALLSVGSVINELSQNCSASAPYLAEFASRIGGVGAMAGMTVSDIMAFGSVLDTQGMKVEAASTALQRVIMHLYQKPAEYAKVAGMDVKKFTELVRTDMNAALIEFLSTLEKAGGMDVLSPMFKDMGENGAGVTTSLSALAKNIETVKAQQVEANKAFAEATSIDKEFAEQNGTLQAQLEKAGERVHELGVALGKELAPTMKYVYSSSEFVLKALIKIINFVKEQKGYILTAVAAWATYTLALHANTIKAAANKAIHSAHNIVLNTTRKTLILLKAAYYAVTLQLGKAKAAQEAFNKSSSRSFWGLILTAITAVIGSIMTYIQKLNDAKEKAAEIKKEYDEWKKSLTDTSAASAEYAAKETARLEQLYKQATNQNLAMEKRLKAVKDLQRVYPEYFGQLNTEIILAGKAATAYNNLKEAIQRAAQMEANKNKLEKLYAQLSTQQDLLEEEERNLAIKENTLKKETTRAKADAEDYAKKQVLVVSSTPENSTVSVQEMNEGLVAARLNADEGFNKAKKDVAHSRGTVANRKKKINDIQSAIDKISDKQVKLQDEPTVNLDQEPMPGGGYVSTTQSEKDSKEAAAKARREAIKAKKEFKEDMDSEKGIWESAMADIITKRSKGEIGWKDFREKQKQIDVDYFEAREKVYQKYHLEEDEDYKELLKKKAEYEEKWLDDNRRMKADELKVKQENEEVQAQIDFVTPGNDMYQNEEALQLKLHDIRIKYLEKEQALYHKSSEEWYNFSIKITQEEEKEKLRLAKRYDDALRSWVEAKDYKTAIKKLQREKALVKKLMEAGMLTKDEAEEVLKKLQREFDDKFSPSVVKEKDWETAGKRMQEELDAQEELYKQGEIKEEEHEQRRKNIKEKYKKEYAPEVTPTEGTKEADQMAKEEELRKAKSLYDQEIISKEEYEKRVANIEKQYWKKHEDRAKGAGSSHTNMLLDLYDAWKGFFDKSEEGGKNWAEKTAKFVGAAVAVMSAGMQSATEYMEACSAYEIAVVEKKYDQEVKLAEGNTYRTKKAERDKEKEIARIKTESSKKQYAMQIAQAVANAAMNALNAYGSAQTLPYPASLILGTLAAAMATAQGVAQIAIIKKQQQTAEVQGYAEGGFTPAGARDKEVGVVHAGEWVASQKLVSNPRVRPLLNALEHAQRTNTIGSLTSADVSRSITAPIVMAAQASQPPVVISQQQPQVVVQTDKGYSDTMRRLADRLDQPFVTVNTVTGDHGINRALEEYEQLIRNKSPKRKYKK